MAVNLHADGTADGALSGSWSCDGTVFRCELDGVSYRGVMNLAWDSREEAWVTCFTALDETGAALWGSRAAFQP